MLIIAFVAAGQLVMGLCLPALPAMALSFHVSNRAMQQSFTLFIVIFGISQLFYGVLSDHYGRRPLLLWGMLISLLGTILAINSASLSAFLLARFLQGLGAGSVSVLGRSIISDAYPREKMAAAMSLLMLAAAITPALSPFLGGQIEHFFGWQSIFIILSIYLVSLIALIYWKMPESNLDKGTSRKKTINTLMLIKNYWTLLQDKTYISYVIIVVLGFSCQLLSLSLAPFIFQNGFLTSVSAYGSLMMIPAAAYIVGNFISTFLNKKNFPYVKIILSGVITCLLFGIILVSISIVNLESCINVLCCIAGINLGYGLIASNAATGAIMPFKEFAGTASSLLGFIQMIGSSLVLTLASFFAKSSSLVLGGSFVILSLMMLYVSLVILINLRHTKARTRELGSNGSIYGGLRNNAVED